MTRQEAAQRLEATIGEWQAKNNGDSADGYATAVCRRLLASEVAASFAAIRPDGTRWDVLLGDCITAERIARTLPRIVAAAIESRKEAEKAAEHAEWLAQFFERRIVAIEGQASPIADAINLLRSSVYSSRLNAERVLWERSRKANIEARRSAGIGWVKGSVLSASGEPNSEHVRTLAEAVFDCEVTIDSVRKAVLPSEAVWRGYTAAKT